MSDLIHKIVGKIIEVGQSDTKKFRLGETIRYSPSEILEILKQHENEIFGEDPSTQPNASNTLNTLDTIYRQAAIVTAVRAAVDWHKLANPQYSIAYCIGEAMRQLPSAQPEQKKGKWVEHKDYPGLAYLCSECNHFTTIRSFFCPNCGAKMEE